MYVLNVTDLNTTNDYDNITDNCTINENNIDIIIPSILLTIPCGPSVFCLMSLMVRLLNNPLFKNI